MMINSLHKSNHASIAFTDYRAKSEEAPSPDPQYHLILLSRSPLQESKEKFFLDISFFTQFSVVERGLVFQTEVTQDYFKVDNLLQPYIFSRGSKKFIFIDFYGANLWQKKVSEITVYRDLMVNDIKIFNLYLNSQLKIYNVEAFFEPLIDGIETGKLFPALNTQSLHNQEMSSFYKASEISYPNFWEKPHVCNDSAYINTSYCIRNLSFPIYKYMKTIESIVAKESNQAIFINNCVSTASDYRVQTINLKEEHNIPKNEQKHLENDKLNSDSTSPGKKKRVNKENGLINNNDNNGHSFENNRVREMMNCSLPKESIVKSSLVASSFELTDIKNKETEDYWSLKTEYSDCLEKQSSLQNINKRILELNIRTNKNEINQKEEASNKLIELIDKEKKWHRSKKALIKQIKTQVLPFEEKKVHLVGLPNLGNTCFINAILQCLLNTPLFVHYFLHRMHLNGSKEGSLTYTFSSILEVILNIDGISSSHERFGKLRDNIMTLKNSVGEMNPTFKDLEQHDAFEFLMTFLEGINNDLNRIKWKPDYKQLSNNLGSVSTHNQSIQHFQTMLSREDSIVTDLFCGQLANIIKCNNCEKEKITFEPFWALPLALDDKNIHPSHAISLEDLLIRFQNPETFEEDSSSCEFCEEKVQCTSRSRIWRLPEILIISLKRFKLTSWGEYKKINTSLKYPVKNLNLSQFVKESNDASVQDPNYSLFGVVNHNGSLKSGHYTANIYKKKWLKYDDLNWNEKRLEDSGYNEDNPYILFYIRNCHIDEQKSDPVLN